MEKITGPEGIDCYRLSHPSGAEATFSLHGGHLISWKTADGIERLFLSKKTSFEAGDAIRGGVPVIFPQFSDHGPLGRHGFARKSEWSLAEEGKSLELRTSPTTLKEWPHLFDLSIAAELTETEIQIKFSVFNIGETSFEFHAALHTYLNASLGRDASISGLSGHPFLNEVTGKTETDTQAEIHFGGETDRTYPGTTGKTIILKHDERQVEIRTLNFPDTVIWNPGPDNGIGDLPPEGWREFICVEGAHLSDYMKLEPGNSWTAYQRIRILP